MAALPGAGPTLNDEYLQILLRLLAALAAGGIIGLERSFRGRAAGFRTHALVCIASSLLMLVTVYEGQWFSSQSGSRVVIDPTRMAQGIMTGIGFLGAGAIMKDGLSVRGLTTAASIWITAAIGILIGIGFYEPAILSALLTLFTLSVFQRIERLMPVQFYAHFFVRFARDVAMPEEALRRLVLDHKFTIANLNYKLDADKDYFEYGMVIRSSNSNNARKLCETLNALPTVREFRLSPTGD
jgi:putative Mg2+ transporter-C (MgtC) family protein